MSLFESPSVTFTKRDTLHKADNGRGLTGNGYKRHILHGLVVRLDKPLLEQMVSLGWILWLALHLTMTRSFLSSAATTVVKEIVSQALYLKQIGLPEIHL